MNGITARDAKQTILEGGLNAGLINDDDAAFLAEMDGPFIYEFLTDREDRRAAEKAAAPKFLLGQIAVTPAADDVLIRAGVKPMTLLKRHRSGDWGEMSEDDKEANDQAIAFEGGDDPEMRSRVMSSYTVGDGTVWIITEWDRSVTTILLPSDY
jgi:hypothetical protein